MVKLKVLERVLGEIKGELGDFDPALITTADAARVFDVFLELERAVVAGKTLVATRAAEAGLWKAGGYRSAAAWVAESSGSGLGEALGVLETSERLASLPETTEALKRGELSAPQVKEITAAAVDHPSSEGELLDMASRRGFRGLRDECRRVKARGVGETEARARYEQIRKNRSVVLWTDHDGVGRIEAKLTPDDLARCATAIRAQASVVFAEARKAGIREPGVAYEADALVALLTGARLSSTGKRSRRPPTELHLRVDLAALRRGRLEGNEVCEIPGVGPVPLATAVNELGNAILRVMVTDGVDVRSVCHVGRTVPAHVRSAVEERDRACVVPGCEVTMGLEIDHYQVAYEHDGPTELWNLARLCHGHHYLKTYCGFALTGDPGEWEWSAPVSDSNPVLTA
jgi:hypothetical protein